MMRTKCSRRQCWSDHVTTSYHVLKKHMVRRVAQSPVHYVGLPTKKSYGTEKFATNGSVDGCSVLTETQFVGTRLCVDTTRFCLLESPSSMGAAGERLELDAKPPLGAPHLVFPRRYLLKSVAQEDTSARERGCEIRVLFLQGVLPKAIEPH